MKDAIIIAFDLKKLLTIGNSVSCLIVQNLDGVHFHNHMEIRTGMMARVLCHLFKWQMFQVI